MASYPKPRFSWDEERTERLRSLWEEGLSASQIARSLEGLTRNAVLGKADRLGLPSRVANSAPRGDGVRAVVPTPKLSRAFNPDFTEKVPPTPPEPEVLAPVLNDGKPLRFPDSSDRVCRWIVGPATADAVICGHPTKVGSVYCAGHAKIAFQPQQNQASRQRQAEATADAIG